MHAYIATVRIKAQSIRTLVHADSALHAQLILQYVFGIKSVSIAPRPLRRNEVHGAVIEASASRIKPLLPTKPRTPAQQRIDTLKAAKDRAGDALARERERQRVQRAHAALVRAVAPKKTNVPPT